MGVSTMRQHHIITREPEPCGGDERHKRDVRSGSVYSLWPYTNVTANIVALNVKYESPPSMPIHFRTAEGSKFFFLLIISVVYCSLNVCY